MARTAVAKASTKTTLPANASLQAEIDEMKARLAAPTGDRVKIDNKSFTLPSGDTSDLLTGCIVDFVYYNAYYESAYDPNNIIPPNCFSIALDPTSGVPSKNSPDVQCDTCQACPNNQFGSAGKGKACRNSILIAMLPPDAVEDTPLILINVSPTGIKPFSAYLSSLLRLQRPPYSVLTDIQCDPNLKYDSLRFSNPQPIEDEYLDMVRSRRAEARERLLVEPDVSAYSAANDAPAPKARAATKGRAQPVKRRA